MRLVLDATPLTMSSGGLARYTADLAVALAETFPGDEYWLASDQPFDLPSGAPPNLRKAPGPAARLERRWWMWGLPRLLRRMEADVFHGTHFAVPYLPACPAVMTVPDISPWLDPSWHSGADRVRRRTPWLLGLGLARRVLTFTDTVRREVMTRFRLPAGRVEAVPLAARDVFGPVEPRRRDRPYFLFVGTLEPRKNVQMLVDAWRPLRTLADLVLIGRRRKDGPVFPEEAGLHWEGEVADADLPAWYGGALAFVYPSLYEGFGLPVLEAMQCGACVITSTDASIAEVAGEACLRLDARQPSAWTEAMRSCAAGGGPWAEYRRRSPRQAALFSWARTARRTREVYADALNRPSI